MPPIPPTTRTRLAKTATDNGFDLDLPAPEGWVGYASSLVPLRIWLTAFAAAGRRRRAWRPRPDRAGLLDYWEGRCALSGLAVPELLRASHIQPWADCPDDDARLDVFNGLLLAAHLDAAFDAGFFTLQDDGAVLVSAALDAPARALLGLDRPWGGAWDHRRAPALPAVASGAGVSGGMTRYSRSQWASSRAR